jgi:hypothetical protein
VGNLSERSRLALTIAVSLLATGGLLGLVLSDRSEMEAVQAEIVAFEDRIQSAAVEEARIPEREDKVLVFRAVEDRELAILPTEQKIADFQRSLSTFLHAAGLSFSELPESSPEDSEIARGIRATRLKIKGGGDAASILKFVNMVENDPRIVAVKGFKIGAGDRDLANPNAPVRHELELELETYFYRPDRNRQEIHVPGAERRLQEPRIQEAIAAFQPERPETYVLRPAASRRDPLVDPRQAVGRDDGPDPEQWEREEAISVELHTRLQEVKEKIEMELAFEGDGDLFRADRMRQEVDGMLNELRARLEQVRSLKQVILPELQVRVERVHSAVEELRSRRPQRDLVVTRAVAQEFRAELERDIDAGAYAEVLSKGSHWVNFLRGKSVEADARPLLDEVARLMTKGRVLGEFHSLAIQITGTIVHREDPSRSVALVNGHTVRVGDVLDEAGNLSVTAIDGEKIVFSYQGERVSVPTRKEREPSAGDPKHEPTAPVRPAPVVGPPKPAPK